MLLYPLRHHAHGARVTRVSATLFLFPSLVSAMISQIIIARSEVVFISFAHVPFVKIQFGFQLSQHNIATIIAINLLMVLLVLLLSHRNFVEYCATAALTALFIFVVAATPDQLVRVLFFSIGTVVLSCAIISNDIDKTVIRVLTRDFIINRLCDLCAFTALIHVLLHFNLFITNNIDLVTNDIAFIYNLLFFVSVVLRLFSLCAPNVIVDTTSIPATKLNIFYRLLLGVGSHILLLFYAVPSAYSSQQMTIFIAIATILVVYALAACILKRGPLISIHNLATMLFASNVLFILLGHKAIAIGIMCALVALYPPASLLYHRRLRDMQAVITTTKMRDALYALLLRVAAPFKTAIVFVINFFINFINIFYAGFILYRLPQFLLATLQMPLRFLNNGSVQRSLIFVTLMLIAYSYWWGEP